MLSWHAWASGQWCPDNQATKCVSVRICKHLVTSSALGHLAVGVDGNSPAVPFITPTMPTPQYYMLVQPQQPYIPLQQELVPHYQAWCSIQPSKELRDRVSKFTGSTRFQKSGWQTFVRLGDQIDRSDESSVVLMDPWRTHDVTIVNWQRRNQ